MIPVKEAPEPNHFHQTVHVPGRRAIAEMIGQPPPPGFERTSGQPFTRLTRKIPGPNNTEQTIPITNEAEIPSDKFPSYWTEALDDLMESYNNVCAYSCFKIHKVTGARSVDHMAPKSQVWSDVYTWKNYRLACSRLNARKKDYSDVLDPFEVEEGWFVLELVGFQVKAGSGLTTDIETKVNNTIGRLQLNNFCDAREQDFNQYQDGDVTFNHLLKQSPFVASEIRRQGRLLDKDKKEYLTEEIRKLSPHNQPVYLGVKLRSSSAPGVLTTHGEHPFRSSGNVTSFAFRDQVQEHATSPHDLQVDETRSSVIS